MSRHPLGGLEHRAKPVGNAIRAEWLVPLMDDFAADGALFFDVFDLAPRADLAVAAADTAAGQCLEPEQFDQTQWTLGKAPCSKRARSESGLN